MDTWDSGMLGQIDALLLKGTSFTTLKADV